MKIREYIQNTLRDRLAEAECLVLYDPDGRYRELALSLADQHCRVVDGASSAIAAREQALAHWLALGEAQPGARQLLVYVPWAKPLADEDRQQDPYQLFALSGDVFPRGEGDTYLSLCLQAKPEHRDRLRELFAAGAPAFETVDALDGGADWPQLRTLLAAQSPREILVGLLSPTERQKTALTGDRSWLGEYRRFAAETLGLAVHAGVATWEEVRDELARFVLFSEFAFDLPEDLPDSLAGVPRAERSRRTLIYAVCEHLRDARTHQEDYIALADAVSRRLNLPARISEVQDFGARDTFAFEERAFLRRCSEAAEQGELDRARTIVDQRRHSLWVQAEERSIAWVIAGYGLELLQAVADREGALRQMPKGMAALIHFYLEQGQQVDTLHRNFERAVYDAHGQTEGLERLIDSARQRHRAFSDGLQKRFVEALCAEGWPPSGFTRHTQVFGKHVAPLLEQNRRVALFMVDALRYELAAEFARRLPDGISTLQAALAQVPTITPVGMAALLPEADGKLRLTLEKGELVPTIDGARIGVPAERIDYVRGLYGDRVAALDLEILLRTRRPKLKDTVALLLIKSTEIDIAGENMAGAALGIMRGVLEKFLRAVRVLQELGFQQAVFAADHGFVLLSEQLPGDKVEKPQGQWLLTKVRCLAGAGSGSPGTACFAKEDLGVRGDLEQLVVPETLGAFKTGETFMHSGLSLQECIIPVLTVELRAAEASTARTARLQLQYRGGKTDRITTRRPMIEIVLFQQDMFGAGSLLFRLEAKAGRKVVGEAAPSEWVDPATGLVTIEPGAAIKVPLRMNEDFEGEFTVAATDPVTQVTFATLKLITDYLD